MKDVDDSHARKYTNCTTPISQGENYRTGEGRGRKWGGGVRMAVKDRHLIVAE